MPDYLTTEAIAKARGKRSSKYRAVPTVWCGQRYPSKAEAIRARELHIVPYGFGGVVVEQPRIQLGPDTVYHPDFLVAEFPDYWVEDVKGRETREFRRIRKLWAKYGPCPLHVMKRKGDGWDGEIIEGGDPMTWRKGL